MISAHRTMSRGVVLACATLAAVALAGAPHPLPLSPEGRGARGQEAAVDDAAFISEPASFVGPPTPFWEQIDEQVLTLAFSPDGKRLVTAGARHTRPGQLKIWDIATGKNVVTLKGMRGIRTVTFAPDGKTLATGHFGGVIGLRDPDSGEERAVLTGHKTGVNGLAFSADGSLLASAGLDKSVRIWDMKELKEKQQLLGHAGSVYSVAFFRHGQAIVTGGADRTARIWDLAAGKEKLVLTGHTAPVESVAVSPDDKLVATASWDKTIKLWDAATGKELGVLKGNQNWVLSVAFSPVDSNLLVSTAMDAAAYVWNVKEERGLVRFGKHTAGVWAAAFSPDGHMIATGSSDETAEIWDVNGTKMIAKFETGTPDEHSVLSLAYCPDGATVAVASTDSAIQLRDSSTGAIRCRLTGHDALVASLAFSPDGSLLASGSADQTVRLWDPAAGKEIAVLKGHTAAVRAVAFAPLPRKEGEGDNWLLASGGNDGTIKLWHGAEKEPLTFTAHDGPVSSLAFAPGRGDRGEGTRLASGSDDGLVKIWTDLTKQGEPIILKGHQGPVRALAYSPRKDHALLASAGADGTVRIWSSDGKDKAVLKGHLGAVQSVTFSPGGGMLISGGEDRAVIIWDPLTSQVRRVLTNHADAVTALAVHPQAEHLLSGSYDASVLRWPAPAAQAAPHTLDAHQGGVWFAAYSPGGDWLASGGQDGAIALWTRSLAPATIPFRSRQGIYWDAAFSPDGQTMALANKNNVLICTAATGQVQRSLPMKNLLRSLDFSPDGKYLAAATGNWAKPNIPYEAAIFDVANGQQLALLEGHNGIVFRIHFSPDGKTVATSSKDNTVRIWDAPSGKLRGVFRVLAPAKGLVFLPDGVLVTAGWDRRIRFFDVQGLRLLKEWNTDIGWGSLDAAPDGSLLVAAESSLESKGAAPLRVFETATGKEIYKLAGHASRILGVAFTRDARGIVSVGGELGQFGEVCYWDLVSGKIRSTHKTPAQWIENLVCSPDGRRVIAAGTTQLTLWDVDFLHKERSWRGHANIASHGVFTDNHTLATGSWDTIVSLWNVASGERIAALKGHKAAIRNLAVSPDRKTLFSASEDGAVRAWDLASRTQNALLEGHTMPVYSVAVSPDGKTLASGGGDHRKGSMGELILWELPSFRLQKKLPEVANTVWSVAFSPDGAVLAASLGNGQVRVYSAAGELRATLPANGVRPLAFSPDGRLLVAGMARSPTMQNAGSGKLAFWDTSTWQPHAVLEDHKHVIFTAAFSPAGNSLASASQDGAIKLWPRPGRGDAAPVPAVVRAAIPNVAAALKKADQIARMQEIADPAPRAGAKLWLALAAATAAAAVTGLLWRRRRKGVRPSNVPDSISTAEGAIMFHCPDCSTKVRCKAAAAGKRIKCPGCGKGVQVPSPIS